MAFTFSISVPEENGLFRCRLAEFILGGVAKVTRNDAYSPFAIHGNVLHWFSLESPAEALCIVREEH